MKAKLKNAAKFLVLTLIGIAMVFSVAACEVDVPDTPDGPDLPDETGYSLVEDGIQQLPDRHSRKRALRYFLRGEGAERIPRRGDGRTPGPS